MEKTAGWISVLFLACGGTVLLYLGYRYGFEKVKMLDFIVVLAISGIFAFIAGFIIWIALMFTRFGG